MPISPFTAIAAVGPLLIKLVETKQEHRETVFKKIITPTYEALEHITDEYRNLLTEACNAARSKTELTAVVGRLAQIRDRYLSKRERVKGLFHDPANSRHLDRDFREFAKMAVALFYDKELPYIQKNSTIGSMVIRFAEGAEDSRVPARTYRRVFQGYRTQVDFQWNEIAAVYGKIALSVVSK